MRSVTVGFRAVFSRCSIILQRMAAPPYTVARTLAIGDCARYNAAMQVRVLFFGRLKEIVGLAEDKAELSEGARVEDLFARYGNRFQIGRAHV